MRLDRVQQACQSTACQPGQMKPDVLRLQPTPPSISPALWQRALPSALFWRVVLTASVRCWLFPFSPAGRNEETKQWKVDFTFSKGLAETCSSSVTVTLYLFTFSALPHVPTLHASKLLFHHACALRSSFSRETVKNSR